MLWDPFLLLQRLQEETVWCFQRQAILEIVHDIRDYRALHPPEEQLRLRPRLPLLHLLNHLLQRRKLIHFKLLLIDNLLEMLLLSYLVLDDQGVLVLKRVEDVIGEAAPGALGGVVEFDVREAVDINVKIIKFSFISP